MDNLIEILALASIGSYIGLLGGIALLKKTRFANFVIKYSVPFAAGVLLTLAGLDLIPEGVAEVGEVGIVIAGGAFIFSVLISKVFSHFHTHDHDTEQEHDKDAIASLVVGDTLHNLIDGIAIASAYIVDPGLGIIVTISTLLHEIPHEIGDFGIMLHSGMNYKRVLLINFLSASSTVVGALLVIGFQDVVKDYLPAILLMTGGMFLHIGLVELIPKMFGTKISKSGAVAAFLSGGLIMYLIIMSVPHVH